MIEILAQAAVAAPAGVTGNLTSAFGLLGAAIGVGLIGFKAAEAVGRNPAASGKILVQAIIGMALATYATRVTGLFLMRLVNVKGRTKAAFDALRTRLPEARDASDQTLAEAILAL